MRQHLNDFNTDYPFEILLNLTLVNLIAQQLLVNVAESNFGYERSPTFGGCLSHPPQHEQGNWFRISQLTSMVAIDFQKPYAKMEVGESCTCMMFIDLRW